MTDYDASTIARFWAKVDKRGPDECWNWTAGCVGGGYGSFRFTRPRKTVRAHTLAYDLTFPGVRAGLHTLHHCDNPKCCNPNHLYPGTDADNARDRVVRGRSYLNRAPTHGTHNPRAILDYDKVEEIKDLIWLGMTNTDIGKIYGVTHSTISLIRHGKTWLSSPIV